MKSGLRRSLALVMVLLFALSATGALAAAKTVTVDEKNFPDATFRAYVQKNIDRNHDNKLTPAEIKAVKRIDVSGDENLSDLTGIKYFTNLRILWCGETSITKLDVSKNTKLVDLSVYRAPLTTLKLGKLKKLGMFDATETNLKTLDISGCTRLLKGIKKTCNLDADFINWSISTREGFSIDTTTQLMKGKKILVKYAKPTRIRFTKKSVTFKANKDYIDIALFKLLRFTPSYCVYPCEFTNSSNTDVCTIEDGDIYFHKKGTTTLTLTAIDGGPSATIKVRIK